MVSCPQIRLSVGLEDTQDLLDDVTQALEVYYYTIELIVCFVLCVCVCVCVYYMILSLSSILIIAQVSQA